MSHIDNTTGLTGFTPKFFNRDLTGDGGNRGVINTNVGPHTTPLGASFHLNSHPIADNKSFKSGNIALQNIPFQVITQEMITNGPGITLPIRDRSGMLYVGDTEVEGTPYKVYIDLTPQAGILMLNPKAKKGETRELTVQYRIDIILSDDDSLYRATTNEVTPHGESRDLAGNNKIISHWSFAPMIHIPEIVGETFGIEIDTVALREWVQSYNLHERLCELAEIWSTDKLSAEISQLVEEVASSQPAPDQLTVLANQLRYLDTLNVSLTSYRDIYISLAEHFPRTYVDVFVKENINLLLANMIQDLNAISDELEPIPGENKEAATAAIPEFFSDEQRAIITSDEKLILVQAGAGTGKSTVIRQRINHLTHRGVGPNDITVLSFTNAAADNIAATHPNIGSMTIARLVNTIYRHNFPTHELSSINTLINSMQIYFPNNDFCNELGKLMLAVGRNEKSSFAELSKFVSNNSQTVLYVLNSTRQTTLELQIVIAYTLMEGLTEPEETLSRHLIVDEVQDTSIFEFIYVMKYVTHHKESLFMVGDASQTLYEFRAANPRALGALEASGVFATYQLTTNYRSNQDVLDFANLTLGKIEANQQAKIQLQSGRDNDTGSALNRVTLNYKKVAKYPEMGNGYGTNEGEKLRNIFHNEVVDYIDSCLARGEKVVFLAYSSYDARFMGEILEGMYPHLTVADIIPQRPYSGTVITSFIKKYWNDVLQVHPAQARFIVAAEITNRLPQLDNNADKVKNTVEKLVREWYESVEQPLQGWLQLYAQDSISREQVFDVLKEHLIQFEIRNNSARKSLENQTALEENKDADFYISTIHSVKGLEFDNVVVMHRNDEDMSEENKRMYYVAFTRAMKSQYVLSYGMDTDPQIVADFTKLIENKKVGNNGQT